MSSDSIPVFLNGRLVHVPAGSTLSHLVAHAAPELATLFDAGQAVATDARGLPVAKDALLSPGAVFRLFRSARSADAAADA